MPAFTQADILKQLDACARAFTFPMLDNGYVYPADTRLAAFGDETRWALVIEVLGFGTREGGHDGVNNALYCFGNCLSRPPGAANEDFLAVTADGPEGHTFTDEFGLYVQPGVQSILIRGERAALDLSPESLAARGVELVDPPQITGADLLRSLLPEHRQALLATEGELRARVPPDLPELLRLNEWRHPDLAGNDLPSESATFQMIADVLVTGDPSRYRPNEPANTHWRNWPEGGTL
ncbi:MAG: DUF7003 family protein [Actinomycetota bacterium]